MDRQGNEESSPKRQKTIESDEPDEQLLFGVIEQLLPYIRSGGTIRPAFDVSSLSASLVEVSVIENAPLLNCRLVCKKWNEEVMPAFTRSLAAILEWKVEVLLFCRYEMPAGQIRLVNHRRDDAFSRLLSGVVSTYRRANEAGISIRIEGIMRIAFHLFDYKENLLWIATRPEFKEAPLKSRATFVRVLIRTAAGIQFSEGDPRSLLSWQASRILGESDLPSVSLFSTEELQKAFKHASDINAWIFYYIFSRDHPSFWSDCAFQVQLLIRARFDTIEDQKIPLFDEFYSKTSDKALFLRIFQEVTGQRPITHQDFLRRIELLTTPRPIYMTYFVRCADKGTEN